MGLRGRESQAEKGGLRPRQISSEGLSMGRVLAAFAMLSITAGVACAQATPPVETFRGSPVRNAFGAGVSTSAGGSRQAGEILRIAGNNEAVAPFLRRSLFAGRYNFALRIGPPLYPWRECRVLTDNPDALRSCFGRNRQSDQRRGLEYVALDDREPGYEWRIYRTKSGPPVLASCLARRAGEVLSNCSLFFEQGRLWHRLETSPIALDDVQRYRCAALDLRNAIWPAGLRFTDTCQR
jgi:hypothetical protein